MLISVVYYLLCHLRIFSYRTTIYSHCLLSYQSDARRLSSQTGQALNIHLSIYTRPYLFWP
jgi:hypothetical protein